MSRDTPPDISLKWRRVVLVCAECEGRKNGPRHLEARDVRRDARHALRDAPVPTRVVATGCLGPCEKKALALVSIGPDRTLRAFALRDRDELDAALRQIAG